MFCSSNKAVIEGLFSHDPLGMYGYGRRASQLEVKQMYSVIGCIPLGVYYYLHGTSRKKLLKCNLHPTLTPVTLLLYMAGSEV